MTTNQILQSVITEFFKREIAFSLLTRGFASGPHWGAYSAPHTPSWVNNPPPPEISRSATVCAPSEIAGYATEPLH